MSNTQFAILILVILFATGTLGRVIGGLLVGGFMVAIVAVPVLGGWWLWNEVQRGADWLPKTPYCVGYKTDDPSGRIDIVKMTEAEYKAWKHPGSRVRPGGFDLYGTRCANVKGAP